MTSIKDIRNWTPEDRNKVRLMVRQLNGVIDSLNYKYWRYKDIAYRERRLTYLTELKKEHQENINNLRKRGEYIYFEIKRLENQYNKPSAEVKKYINILKSQGFYPTPFLNLNAKPVGLKKYYKSIVIGLSSAPKSRIPYTVKRLSTSTFV